LKSPNQSQWPFVVTAGDREVTALGTAFLVRRDEQRIAVTLVEGKVAVASSAASQPALLTPGERLTFTHDRRPGKLDHPAVEKLTAWQRGKVPIDNLSLADAVAEMNRYSVVQLAIERPEAAQLRVSGIFSVGDSLSFARAVSQSYGLKVEEEPRRVVLSGLPNPLHNALIIK